MATQNLGRVKIVWKGEYNSATAYVVDDAVSYEGSSYVCIQNATNKVPTNTSYWSVIAEKGDTGATGASPTITASATTDGTSSTTPTVNVTKSGTDENPNFAFAFTGLKGAKGDKGDTGASGDLAWDDVSKSVQKNLDNPFNKETNNANYNKTTTGYRVYMSEAATYAQLKLWYNNLPKNTDIKITSLIDYTAGVAQIAVSGTNDTWANRQAIDNTSSYTADASAELTFNTGNYNYIIVSLLATLGTSAQGDITFDDYMLRRDSIANADYEPYIPNNTELMTWKANGVLGAKNFVNYNEVGTDGGGTYELTATGIRVYNTTARSWSSVLLNGISLPKNKIIRLKGNITYVSGETEILIQGTNDKSSYTNIRSAGVKKENFYFDTTFVVPEFNYYRLMILCTRGTAEVGDVTINELMLYLAEDTDSTYQPPAMTNRELTEINAGTIDLSHSESTTTPSAHVERTHLKRIGRTCILDFWINFVTVSETSTWKELLRVDLKPTKPALVVCRTGDDHTCAGILDIGGSLKIYPTSAIDNNSVYGQVVYFI